MRRTHTCGELTKKEVGKKVVLQGWVDSRRDHGGIIFIDLRDRYGKTQIVFDEKSGAEAHKKAYSLRREFVIEVEGIVRERKKGTEKKEWATGEIELHCYNLEILSQAETPPLEIDDRIEAGEESRLKYRYLDLRRPIMQHRLLFRSEVAQLVRNFLVSQNFVELETPFLIRSTPEGARDYIVPSRVNPGKVYSLPQSPQLYKQILMVAGFDRYFQLARCLRDEDLRADRQPEFTQIDVEMSFPEEEDIYNLGDKLIYYLFKKSLGIELKIPFPRITYEEAVRKYGIDKPDLRFGMELIDVTEILQKSDFEIFKKAKLIKCINAQQCAYFSRRDIEDLTNIAKNYNAKGLVAMKILGEKIESNVAKYINKKLTQELLEKTRAKEGDLLLIVADEPKITNTSLAHVRNELGKKLNLCNPSNFEFCWVVDFPLFEWNEEEGKWDAAHHIFTMPKKEHINYLEKDPSKVKAQCYDLVLNGVELASGSIRIHKQDIQEKVMKVVGIDKKDAEKKFGFLLEAFKYGAPPHGGFAIGFDRLVAMMLGLNDIREVIAFPKNKNAECPMDGCPTPPEERALRELHIKFDVRK